MTDAVLTAVETAAAPVKKGALRAIRVFLQGILHYILLPVVAALKGIVAVATHLESELGKF